MGNFNTQKTDNPHINLFGSTEKPNANSRNNKNNVRK